MRRPGDEMGSFAAIACAETALTREFGRHVFEIAALLRVSKILYNYRVWVVEAVGHKLATHHPVIEPVSAAEPGTEICDGDESKRALLKAKDIEMFAKPKPKKTGAPKKRPLPLRAKIHSKAAKKPRKKIVKR